MHSLPSCAAGVPIFRVLPAEALDELSKAMHHRRYEKGELVIAADAPVEFLAVVARGRLKLVHTSSSGREQVVRTLGPGESVGEMALFTATCQQGDLVALEETDVCLVPRESVQSIMRHHPVVPLRLVEVLARRLAEAEQQVADLGLRDVGQRLALELLRATAGSSPGPDGFRVTVPGSWAELAVRLGTTPESLSRRLKALGEQGIIRHEGARTVTIRDVERLRKVAEA